MLNDNMTVKGRLHCILTGPDGTVKREWEQDNLVVNAGKWWIAGRMAGTPGVMSHMAVGTASNPTIAAADTTLGTELTRKALTSTTQTAGTNTVVYSATFASGEGTGTLTEAGLFNAASAGTMLARTAISVTKGAADTLTINWTITVG